MDVNDPRRGTACYALATRLINQTIETIGPATFDVLGEGSDERLTDAFYDLLSSPVATGAGPFTLEAAALLNETHELATMEGFHYSVNVSHRTMSVELATEDDEFVSSIGHDEMTSDSLFSVLKCNLEQYTAKTRE